MTIQNAEAFVAGQWDYAILDGCFGETRIKPTDIDFCIERKGHVLYLEAKSPGVAISIGQRMLHEAWVKKGDSVIVVWGQRNKPEKLQVFSPKWPFPHGRVFDPAGVDKLVEIVAAWYRWADTGVCPKVRP